MPFISIRKKPAIKRPAVQEKDSYNGVLQIQLFGACTETRASTGRWLNGLWINVLLLHYSLSFKGLPGGLNSLSIP